MVFLDHDGSFEFWDCILVTRKSLFLKSLDMNYSSIMTTLDGIGMVMYMTMLMCLVLVE